MASCLLFRAALISVFHFGSANFGFYLKFFKVGEQFEQSRVLGPLKFYLSLARTVKFNKSELGLCLYTKAETKKHFKISHIKQSRKGKLQLKCTN